MAQSIAYNNLSFILVGLLSVKYYINLISFSIQFSLCLEDIVPVALGRYIKTLIFSIQQSLSGSDVASSSTENLLEKLFCLFLDQVNLWSDVCSLPEIKGPELTDSYLYG